MITDLLKHQIEFKASELPLGLQLIKFNNIAPKPSSKLINIDFYKTDSFRTIISYKPISKLYNYGIQ
jgi:hypothetical protein